MTFVILIYESKYTGDMDGSTCLNLILGLQDVGIIMYIEKSRANWVGHKNFDHCELCESMNPCGGRVRCIVT